MTVLKQTKPTFPYDKHNNFQANKQTLVLVDDIYGLLIHTN